MSEDPLAAARGVFRGIAIATGMWLCIIGFVWVLR